MLAIVDGQDDPQNGYYGSYRQARSVHQQMKGEDVHQHGSQENDGQRDVAIDQQQHAADDLDRGDQIEIVGNEERGAELAGGAGRQRRLGQEIQETVESEESEDQAHENAGDQCGDFHLDSFRDELGEFGLTDADKAQSVTPVWMAA